MERILEQILGLGIFHTLAQIHDHDLVADVLDHAQIVGDKDIGQLFLILQIHQQIQDLCLNGNVQCRDRLVADDELRVHGQCAADADALAAAAVQLVAETLCITLIQTNGLHDLGDAGIVFVTVFAGFIDLQRFSDQFLHALAGIHRTDPGRSSASGHGWA